MNEFVIFTDLDGTLLDSETYSWALAEPALGLIEERGIPLVIVSSKTRSEIEILREEIGNSHPFIPETGGAVLIPENYDIEIPPEAVGFEDYQAVILSKTADEMARKFDTLPEKIPVQFITQMETKRVADLTGLSYKQARAAQEREFGQAFVLRDREISLEALSSAVKKLGLRLTRGERFFHLMDQSDKGRAVKYLTELYRRNFQNLVTVGLGNSPNDTSFLAVVDQPFLLALPNQEYVPMDIKGLTRIPLAGPAGFSRVILDLLN